MTTKNEKKQMEAKGGKKCTQSKAKESKPAASNKKYGKRNNLIFRQYEV